MENLFFRSFAPTIRSFASSFCPCSVAGKHAYSYKLQQANQSLYQWEQVSNDLKFIRTEMYRFFNVQAGMTEGSRKNENNR